jgi:hypothetical protein
MKKTCIAIQPWGSKCGKPAKYGNLCFEHYQNKRADQKRSQYETGWLRSIRPAKS